MTAAARPSDHEHPCELAMTHSHDLNRTVRLYIGFLAATAVAVIALTVGAAPADYSPAQLVTAAALGAALVVAQRFPIHLTDKTKVCVDTTILIASVLLLSPALAIATAATSAAIYELVARISWEQA